MRPFSRIAFFYASCFIKKYRNRAETKAKKLYCGMSLREFPLFLLFQGKRRERKTKRRCKFQFHTKKFLSRPLSPNFPQERKKKRLKLFYSSLFSSPLLNAWDMEEEEEEEEEPAASLFPNSESLMHLYLLALCI